MINPDEPGLQTWERAVFQIDTYTLTPEVEGVESLPDIADENVRFTFQVSHTYWPTVINAVRSKIKCKRIPSRVLLNRIHHYICIST